MCQNTGFCTFWLTHVPLATAACNFSTSELEKVLRDRQFLSIFTWKCASRHSSVQFLIAPLTTWLRTRRFNEPTFRLTRHTNNWKNTAFCDFSNIWRVWIFFFLLTFALLHLRSFDFTSAHLLFICISTLHIVGSLLFKLPSITQPIMVFCGSSIGLFFWGLHPRTTQKKQSSLLPYWQVTHAESQRLATFSNVQGVKFQKSLEDWDTKCNFDKNGLMSWSKWLLDVKQI